MANELTAYKLNNKLDGNGMFMGDLQKAVYNLYQAVLQLTNATSINETTKALVNELRTDHATFKTAADAVETLIEELHDDHATFKTVVDDIKTLVNGLRNAMLYGALGNPTFAIDTNFDVKSTEPISYTNGGTLKTLADNTNFNTGTAQIIAINKWSSALLSVNASGTGVVTWSATLNAASEALAIAALPALPATSTPLGYITVLTGSGVTWTAGTDALTGGTGGTPATTTNYYNAINPDVATLITAAVATSSPSALGSAKPATGPATLSAAAISVNTNLAIATPLTTALGNYINTPVGATEVGT